MIDLGIAKQGGDFDPYIKYNGKAGRFYMKGADGVEIEVTPKAFIIDFDFIKTGWMHFQAGLAPSKIFDQVTGRQDPQPSPNHKRGFEVRLYSKDFGGVVELSGASMHLNNAIQDAYQSYAAAKDANAGKVPVFEFKGTTPMKDKMGTNYRPTFALLKWVDRPADLQPLVQAAQAAPVVQSASVAAAAQVNNNISEF